MMEVETEKEDIKEKQGKSASLQACKLKEVLLSTEKPLFISFYGHRDRNHVLT